MANKMTKKELDEYKKEKGEFHESDPRHSMNSELTGPSTLSIIIAQPKPRPKKKKMMGGGYMKKKVEMAYGGMSKGKKHMYAAGGSVTDKMKMKKY
jgi:hypothetical protein